MWFEVELVDMLEKCQMGLMYRKFFVEDVGMLFIFDFDKEVSMWMKDIVIFFDMLFLDCNGRIVLFVEFVVFFLMCNIFFKGLVCVVFEFNVGIIEMLGVKCGDRIEY